MIYSHSVASSLKKYQPTFHNVVPFIHGKDKLFLMNLTAANPELKNINIEDENIFASYIQQKIKNSGALYGIGGYNEYRSVYSRSNVFDNAPGAEPRRLHLGIDIW